MRFFEDAAVGDTFMSRSTYRVTAEEIKSFAAQWDPQRYHLDEEEAQKVAGQLFAPAMLTLCISAKLTHDSGYFEISPAAGLGLDEVHMPKPVFVGDQLQVKVTIVAKRDSRSRPGLGVLSNKTEVFNQHGEIVLSYVLSALVYKRPQEPPRHVQMRGLGSLLFLLLIPWVLWASLATAQTPTKTWKTLDELTSEELKILDLRYDTPRDPEIPYLPAEPYPFSPPYTAEELGYLAFDLDTARPRFSHLWLSTVQSMTADGYILNTTKNVTAVLYMPADWEALMRVPPDQAYMRAVQQFTHPPAAAGRQDLWMEYRTDQTFTKKQDLFSWTPSLRRIRRQPPPRRGERFPNSALTFDDLQGRDPWEFSWRVIGTDVLFHTIRFPNTRSTITLTRPDGSSYDQDTTQLKMMGEDYPAYRSDGGVECYVVEARPRPEWLPHYDCSKILYWIDQAMFCPLRMEQYDQEGKLAMVAERLERHEYPEDERLGYTGLVFVFWRTDVDLLTAGVHDYHKKMDWRADHGQTYFTPEFLRREWFLSPHKTQADVPYPEQFYLRPLLYMDKFPEQRRIALSPLVSARIAAQEKARHLVFEVDH